MAGYGSAMAKYAVFSGRASRSEFWRFTAVLGVFLLFAAILGPYIHDRDGDQTDAIFGLVVLIHLLPAFAVSVRRLHDIDRTGWFVLINFIPLGSVVLTIWACYRGTVGPNRFGDDPLATSTGGGLRPLSHEHSPRADFASRVEPTPVGQPPAHDLIGELERLGQLRAAGSLSEAEFEVLKSKAISRGA